MGIAHTKEMDEFWAKFSATTEDETYLKSFDYYAWSFGNTKDLADSLCALVLEGKKTATCSLLRAYRGEENELPRVGLYTLLCDGDNKPRAVILLKECYLQKFNKITEEFARLEGEGDLSYEFWRKAHVEFFSQYEGFHEEDLVICEIFEVAYK
ncbi:MAG: ASCH domain-containing protein [Bdellovibrionota bacterium]|nr:ASCH domain-containing protein [Bdellovibrionota bacterium]